MKVPGCSHCRPLVWAPGQLVPGAAKMLPRALRTLRVNQDVHIVGRARVGVGYAFGKYTTRGPLDENERNGGIAQQSYYSIRLRVDKHVSRGHLTTAVLEPDTNAPIR